MTTLAANTTGNVQYADTNALILGTSTVTGNVDIITGGAITQSGAVSVAGITTLTAGANDIILNNAGNNFSMVGITSGNNVALVNSNALILGASTVSGTLNVTTGGALTQSGALTVTGTTTLTAGANDITLTNAANSSAPWPSPAGITSRLWTAIRWISELRPSAVILP